MCLYIEELRGINYGISFILSDLKNSRFIIIIN